MQVIPARQSSCRAPSLSPLSLDQWVGESVCEKAYSFHNHSGLEGHLSLLLTVCGSELRHRAKLDAGSGDNRGWVEQSDQLCHWEQKEPGFGGLSQPLLSLQSHGFFSFLWGCTFSFLSPLTRKAVM